MAVRAAPFALLMNTRKTEHGAKPFFKRTLVRGALFALASDARRCSVPLLACVPVSINFQFWPIFG
jgi:hypothetical protein